jgi:hypothetical protein
MLSVIYNPFMLSVIMPNVVMLSVIMLNVGTPPIILHFKILHIVP